MTVASSTDRATLLGNGTTIVFPLPFRFFANSEIQAWLVTNATGALTALTLGTHYTLVGAGLPEVNGNAASVLTMVTAPTSLQSLFVQRVIPATQATDIVNQGRFFPEIHEDVFDRLTMLIQQNSAGIKGAIRVPDTDPEPARLPTVTARADKLLSFDTSGNPIAVAAANQSATDLELRLANKTDVLKGAVLVGFLPLGTGAVGRTVANKLGEIITPLDFGAVGDGVANDTVAIQKAVDRAKTIGGSVMFPGGYTFGIQGSVLVRNGVKGLIGTGGIIKFLTGSLMSTFLLVGKEAGELSNVSGCVVDGLIFECNALWGVPIFGQNINTCKITNNDIRNVGDGHGILIRCFVNGAEDAHSNIIANNTISGNTGASPLSNGITLDSILNLAPHATADAFWKATFTAPDATYHCVNNVVVGNKILGGFYGVSLSAASFNIISDNASSFNVRNISIQHSSLANIVSSNFLQDSISSAIHLAYGTKNTEISTNQIYTTRATGQGMLNAYVGSVDNKFVGNNVNVVGTAAKWHIYCGVHSSNNEFSGNTLRGLAAKSYIAIESAWDNTVTNPASLGFGEDTSINAFANTGMNNVILKDNAIYPSSAVPAIFLSQISDGAGNYALSGCVVRDNTVMNDTPSKQLEVFEENSGSLNAIVLQDNSFNPNSGISKFTIPRARAHFAIMRGNTVLDYISITFTAGDTTPSVGVGGFFEHADTSATSVTYYDDGVDGQEITIRLTVFTTIVHNTSFIRLKGSVNVDGSAAGGTNAMIKLRRMSGIWFEASRNF